MTPADRVGGGQASDADAAIASGWRRAVEASCWIASMVMTIFAGSVLHLLIGIAATGALPVDGSDVRTAEAVLGAVETGGERQSVAKLPIARPTGGHEPALAAAPAVIAAATAPNPVSIPDPVSATPETRRLPVEAGTGRAFRDRAADGRPCPFCPQLVVVPRGVFLMGAGSQEPPRDPWQRTAEGPQVEIRFARPFAVGRFAVTFAEWDACADDGGCGRIKAGDGGFGRGRQPVVNIAWDDARSYVDWLAAKTGLPYRLVSEAEREYVTRAGTTTPYWFGAAISTKVANYLPTADVENGERAVNRERPLPVDSFEPNAWGLYNVHGNVWDWTADCWNATLDGAPADGAARQTGECTHRVLRGGSWLNLPKLVRAAARNRIAADFRFKTIGMRVARDLVPADGAVTPDP